MRLTVWLGRGAGGPSVSALLSSVAPLGGEGGASGGGSGCLLRAGARLGLAVLLPACVCLPLTVVRRPGLGGHRWSGSDAEDRVCPEQPLPALGSAVGIPHQPLLMALSSKRLTFSSGGGTCCGLQPCSAPAILLVCTWGHTGNQECEWLGADGHCGGNADRCLRSCRSHTGLCWPHVTAVSLLSRSSFLLGKGPRVLQGFPGC